MLFLFILLNALNVLFSPFDNSYCQISVILISAGNKYLHRVVGFVIEAG